MTDSTAVFFTVNVATPLAVLVALAGETIELPLPAVIETALPPTGFPPESLRVTVTVEVVAPSATTDVGLALTVEVLVLTGPGLKATMTV